MLSWSRPIPDEVRGCAEHIPMSDHAWPLLQWTSLKTPEISCLHDRNSATLSSGKWRKEGPGES